MSLFVTLLHRKTDVKARADDLSAAAGLKVARPATISAHGTSGMWAD